MKTKSLFTTAGLMTAFALAATEPVIKNQSVSFTENRGQVTDQNHRQRPDVLFGGKSGNLAFHLRDNGVSYQLHDIVYKKETTNGRLRKNLKRPAAIEKVNLLRVDITWLGSNPNAKIERDAMLPGYSNYYLESCRGGITHVPSFEGVLYKALYPGIDLHYYNKQGLKYDFIVSPGSDYKKIRLDVKGVEEITVQENGSLLLKTTLGNIEEGAPIVLQEGKQLRAKWVLSNNVLSFEIQNANPAKELIIDPTTRLWGTYYGGSGDEAFFSVSNNAANDAIGGGGSTTATGTLIATNGAYQTSFGGGFSDAILVKFNTAGVRQWATYYGGSGDDAIFCTTDDGSGNIYASGSSDGLSGSVLSTPGSHQPVTSGFYDAFLAKFSGAGLRLWSTYYGGPGDEESNACAADASGNVYIGGYTDSPTSTVIATASSHQPANGGSFDGFLAKFNASGVRQWATYYGGTTDDVTNFCATDLSGNVIITGGTDSNNDIASSGAFLTAFAGNFDGYIAKFSSAGVRQWGTYYGGLQYDEGYGVRTDASGDIFVVGDTESNSGISSPGTHQPNYGTNGDAFVVKFNSAGNRVWATYYGGSAYDDSYGSAVDASGNVYLSGSTETPNGTAIATAGNHQSTFGGGVETDAYLVKFNSGGVRQWGTYYGGTGEEIGFCSTDAAGDVYLCGYSSTTTGTKIASPGSHQSAFSGGQYDAYLAKFASCTAPPTPTITANSSSQSFCASKSGTFTATGQGNMSWYAAATGGTALSTGSTYTTGTMSPGIYTIYAEASDCANSAVRASFTYTVKATPSLTINSNKITSCAGEAVNLTIAGADSYSWTIGGTTSLITVAPITATQYVVVGTNTNGCSEQATISQMVVPCLGLKESENSYFNLFPNPTRGQFYLYVEERTEIQIMNALGQIEKSVVLEKGLHPMSIDKPAGVYLVQLSNSKGIKTRKLIKE